MDHLERHGFDVSVDFAGNVRAVRGVPDSQEGYPLLSFHMDCVSLERPRLARTLALSRSPAFCSTQHKEAPLSLRPLNMLEITQGWLHSREAFVLGGDDKCGASIALTLAATTELPLKIVASVEEERGCVGIEQVDPSFFEDVAYALVLDRRGANHLIVSIGDETLCTGAFAAAMMRAAATTGLLVYAAIGVLSDALTLSRYIRNVVNLSVGYYRPHTVEEHVSLADLWHSYQWVHEALRTLPRSPSAYLRPPFQSREEGLLCPQCQKLTIAPEHLSEDLREFLCDCTG